MKWFSVFNENRDALYLFLRKRVASEEDARDILQELYIRISSFDSKDSVENPVAYLYRVAANMAVDFQRSSSSYQRLKSRAFDYGQSESDKAYSQSNTDPERACDADKKLQAVLASIQKLPDKCKYAFIKYRFGGQSQEEIARELGVSKHSVEKYIGKAMRKCRDTLKRYES